jgi:hypothetical protein
MAYTVLDNAFGALPAASAPQYQTFTSNRANALLTREPVRFNIMSTLAPSSTVPGNIPLLTPQQLARGNPWLVPPPFNDGCDKPPLSQLLLSNGTGFGVGMQTTVAAFPMKRYWAC